MFSVTESNATIPWYSKGAYDYMNDWFLMDSPVPILAIWATYMIFVLKLGPAFMEKRPAFQLRTMLIVYNFLQVLFSLYIFIRGLRIIAYYGLVSSQCLLDDKTSRLAITEGGFIYVLAKISELMDTVLIVLRKKNDQMTFLHLYHHSTMVLSSWALQKYFPNYTFVFSATLNSFMHVIMYTYYGLAVFSSLAKHLWWKKYVTILELIHLVVIAAYICVETWFSKCGTPYAMVILILFNISILFYYFSDFYLKKYKKKSDKKKHE